MSKCNSVLYATATTICIGMFLHTAEFKLQWYGDLLWLPFSYYAVCVNVVTIANKAPQGSSGSLSVDKSAPYCQSHKKCNIN